MKTKKQKVLEYNAVFQEEKEGGYSVWVPELGAVASQGETFEEAFKNIKEAIELYLEDDLMRTEVKNQTADESFLNYKRQFFVPVQIAYA